MTTQLIKFQAGERIAGPDGARSTSARQGDGFNLAPAFHPVFCVLTWLGVSFALWAAIVWLGMMLYPAVIQ